MTAKLEPFAAAPAMMKAWMVVSNTANAALASTTRTVGAFPLPGGSRDAALLVQLMPGMYTAQVSGVNGTTGVALVEVYEAP